MEEDENLSGSSGGTARDVKEMRQKRLAYFQNAQPQQSPASLGADKSNLTKLGGSNGSQRPEAGRERRDKEKLGGAKTSQFHVSAKTEATEVGKRPNSGSERNEHYTHMRGSGSRQTAASSKQPSSGRRRVSASSVSDDEVGPLITSARSAVNVKPGNSGDAPLFSKRHHPSPSSKGQRVSGEDIQMGDAGHRGGRSPRDSEVESLFSNRKWMSGNEIPALSLKESMDVDAVSVFKSSANFDDLGLSTHRPESLAGSGVIDYTAAVDRKKGNKNRQRSVSSESLLLGAKGEEIRSLLGEKKYRELVEKSERELEQLHRAVEVSGLRCSSGSASERSSRIDHTGGGGSRSTPTPPSQAESPQPTATTTAIPSSSSSSMRGPSPRRRLRSSSPQQVSKTLQDIARTREGGGAGSASRNYEQVVVPHNVTFSSDEIYRQAFGGGGGSGGGGGGNSGGGGGGGGDVRKSSTSSVMSSSSYQDPAGAAFWSSVTPRQVAGSLSPSTPHGPHPHPQVLQAQLGMSGVPIHTPPPPPPQQHQHQQYPVYAAGSSGVGAGGYFYSPGPAIPVSVSGGGGGGGGQYAYPGQNVMMGVGVAPGTSSPLQSPSESYLYHNPHHPHPHPHHHPMAQGVQAFNHPPSPSSSSSSPVYNPAAMSWQYGPHAAQQHFQGHPPSAQPFQGHPQQGYGGHFQGHEPHAQSQGQALGGQYGMEGSGPTPPHPHPHPPSSSGGGKERGGESRTGADHVEAVRQYHQHRRQITDNKTGHSNNNSTTNSHNNAQSPPDHFSSSSLERYFASLGVPPPSSSDFPPPSYSVHPPPQHQHHHQQQQQQRQQQHRLRGSAGGRQNVSEADRSLDSSPSSYRRPAYDSSQDFEDDLTMVTRTSMVSGPSVAPEGITERMQQLGVDPQVILNLKQRSESLLADAETLEAMRSSVRVCPECRAVNKEYMTWCLHCGGVLIGVDPVPTRDLKKKSGKGGDKGDRRGGGGGSSSANPRHRRSYSQPQPVSRLPDKRHPVPVEHLTAKPPASHHPPHQQQPLLEYGEDIEVIYDDDDGLRQEPTEDAEQGPTSFSPQQDQERWTQEDTKESPESGRGGSATSSPARRVLSRELSGEEAGDVSQNTLEVMDNKDSGRPSSGEGTRKPQPQYTEIKKPPPKFTEIKKTQPKFTETKKQQLQLTETKKQPPQTKETRKQQAQFSETKKQQAHLMETKKQQQQQAQKVQLPPAVAQMVPEGGPRRSEREINDICGVINDPIIRGFIKNYLQKKPHEDDASSLDLDLDLALPAEEGSQVSQQNVSEKPVSGKATVISSASSTANIPGSNVSSSTTKSKTPAPGGGNGEEGKTKTKRKKGGKKPVKKGHEAIDVEIFGIEEAKLCRSSLTGAGLVPMLNLRTSSDEEDDSSERTSSLGGGTGPGGQGDASSDANSSLDEQLLRPINYDQELRDMAVQITGRDSASGDAVQQWLQPDHQHASTSAGQPASQENQANQMNPVNQVNPDLAHSNFQFLQQLVETPTSPGQPGHQPGRNSGPPPPPKQKGHPSRPPATSKVRASIQAAPPNRRWMRSSVAWSSYNPRELRTRSSLLPQPQGQGRGLAAPANVKASRSTDNLTSADPRVATPPSQRPRPASADQSNRRGASSRGRGASAGRGGRPLSAGHHPPPSSSHPPPPRLQLQPPRSAFTDQHAASPSPTSDHHHHHGSSEDGSDGLGSARDWNVDVEGRPIHRLPLGEDTLPLIPSGPSAASKIYDRCFEMSPRGGETEQVSRWLFLPDELWLHVLTFLPQLDLYRLTLTCKQLLCIALDPQLWRRVTVRKKPMTNEWLAEIGKRHPVSMAMVQCHGDTVSENALREFFKEVAPKLKELNFSRCSRGKLIGDEILLHASTHCRHLTHVDASWCHVTDVGLSALAGCCHRLESLCLNGCQRISDESLKAVLEKHGSSLRVLELFGCFGLTPASFRSLAENCTFLLTLNMGQCYKISDSNMVTLSASLSRVETLDLRGCKKLGDNSIRKIVRCCRRLRHLTLANCPLISNASVVEIATYSADVRSLDVCGCSLVTDSSIKTLASNCHRLTSLDISSTSCTHKSVLSLAECCRHLETAKLNFLADVHDTSLSKLIKSCKRLTTVHLYGCNVRDGDALRRINRFLKIEM